MIKIRYFFCHQEKLDSYQVLFSLHSVAFLGEVVIPNKQTSLVFATAEIKAAESERIELWSSLSLM